MAELKDQEGRPIVVLGVARTYEPPGYLLEFHDGQQAVVPMDCRKPVVKLDQGYEVHGMDEIGDA